jgi:hypothetical protein
MRRRVNADRERYGNPRSRKDMRPLNPHGA